MWSIFENVPCALEKNVYFASLGWKALYISVKSIRSRTLFNVSMSLLIFCLEDLFFFDSGVLKSPTIIVLLSIFFLKSSKIFFMYLGAPMFAAYIYNVHVFLMDSSLRYYDVTFWVSFYGPFSEVYFVWYEYCYSRFFFLLSLLVIFVSSPSLSICVGLLFWRGSLVGSICVVRNFWSIHFPMSFDWSI